MVQVVFLGTGGGRFATIYQSRSTAGIYIEDSIRIHIDPGPGTVLRMRQLGIDPTSLEALLVSHGHPDHYIDLPILVEAVTRGGTVKRGTLLGSRSVIEGTDKHTPAVTQYHKDLIENVITCVPGTRLKLRHLAVVATPTEHTDETGIGFRIYTSKGIISYTGDTQYFDDLPKSHRHARLLIVSCTRPRGYPIPYHLSTPDAAKLAEQVRPEMLILTHLGIKMLRAPEEEAAWIEEKTGVRTVAAKDGMRVAMDQEIVI